MCLFLESEMLACLVFCLCKSFLSLVPSLGEDFKTKAAKADSSKSSGTARAHKAAVGQKQVEVLPLAADKSRSDRPKRAVQEEGKTIHIIFHFGDKFRVNFAVHV